nr:hypothetical protein BgiMline_002186 [Biomphalaria glabrata]
MMTAPRLCGLVICQALTGSTLSRDALAAGLLRQSGARSTLARAGKDEFGQTRFGARCWNRSGNLEFLEKEGRLGGKW